jgi:hypothetical protein
MTAPFFNILFNQIGTSSFEVNTYSLSWHDDLFEQLTPGEPPLQVLSASAQARRLGHQGYFTLT